MMKNLAISTLLFFICAAAIGDSKEAWAKYYALVDTAEISIVDSTYQKALTFYKKAFELVDHPFGKDYYNAVLCANFLGNYKDGTFYMGKLLEKGLDFTYFSENPLFEDLRNSKEWKSFTASYKKYHEKHQKQVNLALRKEFESMLEKDQYYNNLRMNKGYEDSIFFVSYRHVQRFIEIVNKYGFPDENRIGLPSIPYNYPYGWILIHFLQEKAYFNNPRFIERKKACLKSGINFNSIDIFPILKKAMQEGKYLPMAYANLSSAIARNTFGRAILLQVDDTIAEVKYAPDILIKIDSARREINLCSFDQHKKKALFEIEKLMHFRAKLKSESPELYSEFLGKAHDAEWGKFNFGLPYPIENYFFIDKDPKHEEFRKSMERLSNVYD
jgi:hypothetical protein